MFRWRKATPLRLPARAAAHQHAGDLANVPRFHGLIESARAREHNLRGATARARRVVGSGGKGPRGRAWAAAHPHAGDLANVPRFHGLVESVRAVQHILRRAAARAR